MTLLAIAVASCRERPVEPVLQLIDRVEDAEVDNLPPARLRWTRDQNGPIGSASERTAGRVASIRLGSAKKESSARQSLVALAGGRYRMRFDLPRNARLAFAIGAYGDAPVAATIGFSIRIRPLFRPGEAISWREELAADRLNAWWERSLDLSALGGGTIEIELANDGDARLRGGWGAPLVIPDAARDPRPDILLISLDTVRADHLGAWGYERPTSPHLDRLASSGFRFAQAIAQSCWTRPSHRAMLSGLAPSSRGGLEPHPIGEPLWHAGYETLAFTGGGQVDATFGFARGFESYGMTNWIQHPEALAERLAERRGRPIFAFLHTYAPHDPYDDDRFAGPPLSRLAAPGLSLGRMNRYGRQGVSKAEKGYIEALYDGDIAFTDEQVGKLFEALRRTGVMENAIVVVTSDHGEQFWEHHEWRHGSSLYDHDIHVPLIVTLPDAVRRRFAQRTGRTLLARGVVDAQVRSIDIYPTLLELAGVELPGPVQGRSLVPWLAGESMPPVDALSESITHRRYELKALRTERAKLLRVYPHRDGEPDPGSDTLYDLRDDPEERVDVAHREPRVVDLLATRLEELTRGGSPEIEDEVPAEADAELRRELEALGYLGGAGDEAETQDAPP